MGHWLAKAPHETARLTYDDAPYVVRNAKPASARAAHQRCWDELHSAGRVSLGACLQVCASEHGTHVWIGEEGEGPGDEGSQLVHCGKNTLPTGVGGRGHQPGEGCYAGANSQRKR